MPVTDYKIATDSHIAGLEVVVKTHLLEGFEPIGCITTTRHANGSRHMQVMIKREVA